MTWLSLVHTFPAGPAPECAYVLQCALNSTTYQYLATVHSDATVSIFDTISLKLISSTKCDEVPTAILFQESKLWLTFKSGKIRAYDFVNGGLGRCNDEIDIKQSITSIDVNSTGQMLAIGSEQSGSNIDSSSDFAFISLFDLHDLQNTPQFTYTDSHSDGVSALKFHPNHESLLISGGLDGLVNVFDITQSIEDDALLQSFNSESSVKSVGFVEGSDCIYCVTDDSRIGVWNHATGDEIITPIKNQISSEKYPILVDCFSDLDSVFGLLTNENGEIAIARWKMILENGDGTRFCDKTYPCEVFDRINLKSVHSDAVHCICYHKERQVLVTGGDDSIIAILKVSFEESLQKSLKPSKNKSNKRKKPY